MSAARSSPDSLVNASSFDVTADARSGPIVPETSVRTDIALDPYLCYFTHSAEGVHSPTVATDKTEHDQALPLRGARILVVEDEFYIADDLRRALHAAGALVVGPVSTVVSAQAVLDRAEFDCAVIDLNLHGESALPLADRLAQLGKSFAIATGYGSETVPERLKGIPRIEKPFGPPVLVQLMKQLGCANP